MKRIFTLFFLILIATFSGCIDPNTVLETQNQLWLAGMDFDDSVASIRLGTAAVCLQLDPDDPAVNRNKMINMIDLIASEHPDIRLIVFGEASLGYYYRPTNPQSYQQSLSESIPGPTSTALSAKAIEYDIYISFGLTESSGDLYNSQVLINPDGSIASTHRKNFLTDWDIENGFSSGSGVTFNTIDGIKTATIICYDSMSEKILREIAQEKPQLILLPLADLVDEDFVNYDPVSFMSHAWVIVANRFGTEDGSHYDGHHWISTPTGSYRVKATGKEGYVFTEVGICEL